MPDQYKMREKSLSRNCNKNVKGVLFDHNPNMNQQSEITAKNVFRLLGLLLEQ